MYYSRSTCTIACHKYPGLSKSRISTRPALSFRVVDFIHSRRGKQGPGWVLGKALAGSGCLTDPAPAHPAYPTLLQPKLTGDRLFLCSVRQGGGPYHPQGRPKAMCLANRQCKAGISWPLRTGPSLHLNKNR